MINDLKDMDRDNSSCILYCNSIAPHGVHEKETVALTIIKMLNWVYEDKNHDKKCSNGENMRNYNLKVPLQKDNWSCNLQMILAKDAFVSAFLDKKKYITNADREDDFKSFGEETMSYNVSDVHIIRQGLLKIMEGTLSLRNNIPSLRRVIEDRTNMVEYDQLSEH